MGKLYDESEWKNAEIGKIVCHEDTLDSDGLREDIADTEETLQYVSEAFKTAFENIKLVTDMSSTLNEINAPTASYFTSLENYTSVLESISSNLGVRRKFIPSMETFSTPYGFKASHQVAMEGFKEFLKKLWERIKEVFNIFFKKINIFLRRLMKYDLDVDSYEKYLEKLMSMIKSKKPAIKDKTVLIDTKLPSLLASPGMESINTDFLVEVGIGKVMNFTSAYSRARNKVIPALRAFTKDGLVQLIDHLTGELNRGELSSFISDTSSTNIAPAVNSLKDHTDDIKKQMFGEFAALDPKSLPDEVINAIQLHLDRTQIQNSQVYTMFDFVNVMNALPKNYNCFLFSPNDNYKIFVQTSKENNLYVKNSMYPITSSSNLVSLYEDYKKFSKTVDMNKFGEQIKNASEDLDDVIKKMQKSYEPLMSKFIATVTQQSINSSVEKLHHNSSIHELVDGMEKLLAIEKEKLKNASNKEARINELIAKLILISNTVSDLIWHIDELFVNERYETNFTGRVHEFLSGKSDRLNLLTTDDKGNGSEDLLSLLADKEVKKEYFYYAYTFFYTKLVEEPLENNAANPASMTQAMSNYTEEQLTAMKVNFKLFNDIVINFITAIKNIIKSLAVDMAAIYVELRFELVKYIYKNALLYDHSVV